MTAPRIAVPIAVLLMSFVGIAALAQPAGSPPPDFSVEDSLPLPGTTPDPQPVSVNGSVAPCVWVRNSELDSGLLPGIQGDSNGFWLFERCNGAFTSRRQWVVGAAAAPGALGGPPAPVVLANVIWARLEGSLPTPEVGSDPVAGEASLISFPTFVQVDNWSGVVTEDECDPTGALCVSVTATPALSFVPGEPGSRGISCAGSGTRFVPGGLESSEQAAAPGACAYAYRLRTGVDGRPAAWPGVVTVTWDLSWSSTSGAGGPLPDIVKSTSMPRAVHEVQTVIVGGGENDE